jgi:lauroyl/myristoyl acyltransferase
MKNILDSKFAVQFSILVGKYLPRPLGLGVGYGIGSAISLISGLEINQAIRNNQSVIRGLQPDSPLIKKIPRRVLKHAGHCYFDLHHYYTKPEKLAEIVPWTAAMEEFVKFSQEDQGYVVVAPHLSNFDIVVARLVLGGFQGTVLSYPNPGSGYLMQNDIRRSLGMDVIPLGDSSLEAEIVETLKAGGLVATGVDRPIAGRKRRHYVKFFGHPSPLPLGYITTALAADVPIIPVASVMLQDGNYGFKFAEPIRLERFKNKLDSILINAERVLKVIEGFILEVPDQWLMYYPAWPDLSREEI